MAMNALIRYLLAFLICIAPLSLHAGGYMITQILKNGINLTESENVYILCKDSKNIYRIISENKNILGWYLNPGDIVQITSPEIEVVLSGENRFSFSPAEITRIKSMLLKEIARKPSKRMSG